jgi:uncharacterized protein involved in exopolysaccharide biosynthesis
MSRARARHARRRLIYLIEAPLRRRSIVLVPVLALGIVAGVVAQRWPDRYRAAALIRADWDVAVAAEIERRGVALDERRLQGVRQRVTERGLLESVLREAALDAAPGAPPPEAQLDGLAADLGVRPMSASSFVIEFTHADPRTAARVANLLVRQLAAAGVSDRPSAASRAEIEARVADALLLVREKEDALARLSGSRAAGPGAGADARAVAASLAEARAREKRLLEAVAAEPRAASPASEAEIERVRDELRALRQRYTDEHPDVERLRRELERLESSAGDSAARAELRGTQAVVASLEKRQAELESSAGGKGRRGAPARPATAAERSRAVAEAEAAQRIYQARLEELVNAIAGPPSRGPDLRFEVVREATVPDRSDAPSALLLVLAGALAGLAIGLLAALVAEHRDERVKGPEDLNDVLSAPILATLPLVRQRRFGKSWPERRA